MDAAVEVFYDLVLNYHPDALSPDYDAFYEAAEDGTNDRITRGLTADKQGDQFAHMRLMNLSSALVGIEKQTMSYRRDIVDKDHPTDFYDEIMNPEEKWLSKFEPVMEQSAKMLGQKLQYKYIKMERTYLNGYSTFYKRTENIPQVMEKLLEKKIEAQDIYSAFRALNVCKFQAEDLRDKLGSRFDMASKKQDADPQALVDGIVGLAGCTYKPINTK